MKVVYFENNKIGDWKKKLPNMGYLYWIVAWQSTTEKLRENCLHETRAYMIG